MKINEITLDPHDVLVGRLREGYSNSLNKLFEEVEKDSNKFSSHAREVYSLDEIGEFIQELKIILSAHDMDGDFGNPGINRIVSYLLQYFSE